MAGRRALTRAVLRKPAPDDDAMEFVASSPKVNRYGFALRTDGWLVDNFNANPVILWHHLDFIPPIGRGRAVKGASELTTRITWDRSDPLGARVEQKYRDGFLNAVSVGFDFVDKGGKPLGAWWNLSAEQIRDEAFYDLAEVSAVPVPADASALVKQSLADMGLELVDLAGLGELGDPDKGAGGRDQAREALMQLLREALLGSAPAAPTAMADPRVDQLLAELAELRARLDEVLAGGEKPEGEGGGAAAPNERAVQDFLAAIRL